MELLGGAASSQRKNWIGDGMARDKRRNGAGGVSEEVVNAFEAGIVFGRMVEARQPRRDPLWTDEEWLQALIKAVGKEAESKVLEWNEGISRKKTS
jgi:hypothetical protein